MKKLEIVACMAILMTATACATPKNFESARIVAQDKLSALLAAENMKDATAVLIEKKRHVDGWFFDYRVTLGSDSRSFTVFVGDDGGVEISREGRE